MGKLTAAERKKLPASAFAMPKQRKFPIEDAAHAKDALGRASARGPAALKAVAKKVAKKFPAIDKSRGGALKANAPKRRKGK